MSMGMGALVVAIAVCVVTFIVFVVLEAWAIAPDLDALVRDIQAMPERPRVDR